MKYPRWGKEVKEEMYTLFEVVSFQIDLENFENIEPRVFAAWHAHDIKEGYDTAY